MLSTIICVLTLLLQRPTVLPSLAPTLINTPEPSNQHVLNDQKLEGRCVEAGWSKLNSIVGLQEGLKTYAYQYPILGKSKPATKFHTGGRASGIQNILYSLRHETGTIISTSLDKGCHTLPPAKVESPTDYWTLNRTATSRPSAPSVPDHLAPEVMEETEPKGVIGCFVGRKQVHLRSPKPL